jgi:uncharacterized protein
MQIGLISDTHMPSRWKTLSPIVFEVFSSCDVILHSGDVGELWVLDQLSKSAPVVAVHGNDETSEASAALPFVQTFVCEGHRIVLTHSHYPDNKIEMAQRTDDSWYPKLQYRANFGKAHGAKIVVSGHTHIPMQVEHDGVLLVNPGAVASGNEWTKQVLQTVAVMTLAQDATPQVQFIDINTGREYVPKIDWDKGFLEQAHKTSELIVSDDLLSVRGWFMETLYPQNPMYLENRILPLCHEVWAGEREIITLEDVVKALTQENPVPADMIELLSQHEAIALYL